ncbi:MAG: glycosyltransferase [Alphaproteobacteria bacterium]|nr:glycosyltransferase [Alphaproteobacteria bacterium]
MTNGRKQKCIFMYKARNLLGSAGGIERATADLANELHSLGYDVVVGTRDTHEGEMFFKLQPGITLKHFSPRYNKLKDWAAHLAGGKSNPWSKEAQFSRRIHRYLQELRPDFIIAAGIKDLRDLTLTAPLPCKCCLQLHQAPEAIFKAMRDDLRGILDKADCVQVLHQSFADVVRRATNAKIVVIPNMVRSDLKSQPPESSHLEHKMIVYPARIEPDKQQAKLIKAFAKTKARNNGWQLTCYGQAKNRKYHQLCLDEIKKNGLEGQARLCEAVPDIGARLRQAEIGAFPSLAEGFGLGLAEMMAAGLPVVGFLDAKGVNNLINHRQNGYLAKDENDFARWLDKLAADKKLRQKLGRKAKADIAAFAPDKIVGRWEEVINA